MKTVMFPGQGSQYRGMGKELFSKYKSETILASDILGYDLAELCTKDPNRQLANTQFTQPALYAVNAFRYYDQLDNKIPDYLIGHSLGEYNALLAAGVFDFETGLRLVKKRGELMAAASGGGMAAVLGLDIITLKHKMEIGGYQGIDIANFNTPTQIVISGPQQEITKIVKDFDSQDIKIIPLFVTAPFHSRYMKPAADEFTDYLKKFEFNPIKVPVISNVTARPYTNNDISNLLSEQIVSSVNWIDTIRFLKGKNIIEYKEIGSDILTKMVNEIKESSDAIIENTKPIVDDQIENKEEMILSGESPIPIQKTGKLRTVNLGSATFRKRYGVKYAYVTGAMYRGIASKELIVRMGKANMLSFLGTGGMSLEEIETNIEFIQSELTMGEPYGLNLLYSFTHQSVEMDMVKLFLKYSIQIIEVSKYMQITLPLVYYRVMGLRKNDQNTIFCDHKIVAKVSRPEMAEAFMKPPSERVVNQLLDQGLITPEQAKLSRNIPMSHDICVVADSGGDTDGGVSLVLFPSIQSLYSEIKKQFDYTEHIHLGLAGGLGTPQSVACAFVLGADFVLTGSINQCTVEAKISNSVKDLLQDINVQDTDYAPSGDMFEIGAKVQVLKKGVLFSTRANKLYALYQQYNGIEEIPQKTIDRLESSYFKKPINDIWKEIKTNCINERESSLLKEAEQNPKKKMALIFRWYFDYSNKLSFKGEMNEKTNFQVHTGPALGAFNQWVKGTELENWRNRHSDVIGIKIMEEAAKIMKDTLLGIYK